MIPKAQATKDKLSFIEIRHLNASKDTVKKANSRSTEWQEVFASQVSDKDLVSRICREFLQLSIRKTASLSKLNITNR